MTITEYNRPNTLAEALALIQRAQPLTLPLAGGTALVRPDTQAQAVVDLQALGLDQLQVSGNALILGATLTLQALLDWLVGEGAALSGLAPALAGVIRHEATHNLRQAATVAGTLAAAGGRSPFAAALLALDATVTLEPGGESVALGDLLPTRSARLPRRLITQVSLPANAALAYEYVARSPADRPIVCVAVARWPSGRTRLALGGYGMSPALVLDGSEDSAADAAAASAYSQAGDQWASAEYRSQTAQTLTRRCLAQLTALS
jgi:CO/xanthine dehydrogenase FAD-binding subunit